MDHPTLGQSPRDAFEQGMLLADPCAHCLIAYSEDFLMLTHPTTRVGTVKIHPLQAHLQAFIEFRVKHPRLEEIDHILIQAIYGHRSSTLLPLLESGVKLVECPTCASTRSLSARNGVLRFPAHDKRKTRTPNTEQRWVMEQTTWEVVGGEST